jgi:hypothetical protein
MQLKFLSQFTRNLHLLTATMPGRHPDGLACSTAGYHLPPCSLCAAQHQDTGYASAPALVGCSTRVLLKVCFELSCCFIVLTPEAGSSSTGSSTGRVMCAIRLKTYRKRFEDCNDKSTRSTSHSRSLCCTCYCVNAPSAPMAINTAMTIHRAFTAFIADKATAN